MNKTEENLMLVAEETDELIETEEIGPEEYPEGYFLIRDDEVRTLSTPEEYQRYITFRQEHDVWLKSFDETGEESDPLLKELRVIPVETNEILMPQILAEYGMEADDPAVMGCMGNIPVFVTVPVRGIMKTFATGSYFYGQMLSITGLGGSSMTTFKDTSAAFKLPLDYKAEVINRCLDLRKKKVKLLFRDGAVRAVLSEQYQVFPIWELNEILEEQLREDHPDYEFLNARISQEFTVIDYDLNDVETESRILGLLEEHGCIGNEYPCVKCGITLTTSDIGAATANVTPYFEINELKVPFGKVKGVKHLISNQLEQFRDRVSSVGNEFRECEENIEVLGNIRIDDVAETVRRITQEYSVFPKAFAEPVINELQFDCSDAGTAMDVYLALAKIVTDAAEARGFDIVSYLSNMEFLSTHFLLDPEMIYKYDQL